MELAAAVVVTKQNSISLALASLRESEIRAQGQVDALFLAVNLLCCIAYAKQCCLRAPRLPKKQCIGDLS
jgi:hypothetical protein